MATVENKLNIMQDKGSWRFSDDLIIRIKQGDTAAIADLYNANYDIFAGMARKFVLTQRNICRNYLYEFEDLIQQVYVDIPYYDYSSRCNLYYCIVKGTFMRVNNGGILSAKNKYISASRVISYDAPVMNKDGDVRDGSYMLDRLVNSPDAFEVIIEKDDREAKDKAICDFLERTITNQHDLNIMWCKLFTDLPLNEIRGDEYEHYKQCAVQSGRERR